jgi:transcriptional regulator with XRE-family HTH domain
MMEKQQISNRIINALNRTGISQRQLADATGMTEVSISRYVKGKRIPSAEILGRIADVLGVTTDYLITGKTEPTKHVEMIVDYLVDGDDYQYSDNKGILVRCRDCKRWNANMKNCAINPGVWERNDYCSMPVR